MRQFFQIGAEIINDGSAEADAEIIVLLDHIYRSLDLTQFEIRINSVGCGSCRPGYRTKLQEYFKLVSPSGSVADALNVNDFPLITSTLELMGETIVPFGALSPRALTVTFIEGGVESTKPLESLTVNVTGNVPTLLKTRAPGSSLKWAHCGRVLAILVFWCLVWTNYRITRYSRFNGHEVIARTTSLACWPSSLSPETGNA